MERVHHEIWAPGFDRPGVVIRYGHYGKPVIVFPSEAGRAWDFENNGMVAAVADLIDAGRIKLYCVDSFDDQTWSDRWIDLEERARRHGAYQRWMTQDVVGWIGEDSPGARSAVLTGCSLGAYHALQLALQRADLFPEALCLSGNYDPSTWHAWGQPGEAAYFANPTQYVPNLHGDHLTWLRSRLHLVLTVGRGAWETHPTGALPSTRHMGGLLQAKGIWTEVDEWGDDVSHDWHWWRRILAHQLPRFC